MNKFTPEFIAEQRVIADKAPARPWKWFAGSQVKEPDGTVYYETPAEVTKIFTVDMDEYMGLNDETAAFIAAAANNYPAALDEIERLRAANANLLNECKTVLGLLYGMTPVNSEYDIKKILTAAIAAAEGTK